MWYIKQVAEAMVDPYGDDDADFELNFLLDRHAQVTILVSRLYNSLISINFK